MAESIRILVQRAVDSAVIAGAVTLVADADGILDAQGFGVCDAATGSPMPVDALFWVASMSKPVTGTAAMLLVDEGLLDLDKPIATYLPEWTDQMMIAQGKDLPAGTTVLVKPPRLPTIRDALSHTAGLPMGARPELMRSPHHSSAITIDRFSLAHAASVYALTPLATPPGSTYSYSNIGINAVGRVIEVVTGQDFAVFVHKRLLQPLGMKDTTFWPSMEQIGRLSKCYTARREGEERQRQVPLPQLTPPYGSRRRGPSPAGGYFSTAADYARFGRMLLREGELDGTRYLSKSSVRELSRSQTGELGVQYGLGFQCGASGTASGSAVSPGHGASGFGHGGAVGTELWVDPAAGKVTVFMVHQDGGFGAEGAQLRPSFKALGVALTRTGLAAASL